MSKLSFTELNHSQADCVQGDCQFLISAEHASKEFPDEFHDLAEHPEHRDLASHRFFDRGTAHAAKYLSDVLKAPYWLGNCSRLLVDLNRSVKPGKLFGPVTSNWPEPEKARLLSRFYQPFRGRIQDAIAENLKEGRRVIHLSIHSFTPVLGTQQRNTEVGLLYDPRYLGERRFATQVKTHLNKHCSSLRIRKNYPYQGKADGHVTALRKLYHGSAYIGIEIELGQQSLCGGEEFPEPLLEALRDALEYAAKG